MAAMAGIQLKNYAAVEQTYNVESVNANLVGWVETGAASLIAGKRATLGIKFPKDLATGTVRLTGKLTYPVTDGVTGALLRTPLATFDIVIPAAASQTERREMFARFKDFVGDAVLTAAVDDLAIPY